MCRLCVSKLQRSNYVDLELNRTITKITGKELEIELKLFAELELKFPILEQKLN